jgi:hypothetical protein
MGWLGLLVAAALIGISANANFGYPRSPLRGRLCAAMRLIAVVFVVCACGRSSLPPETAPSASASSATPPTVASTAASAAEPSPTGTPEGEAQRAAEAWLADVDAQRYAESWTGAAALFRGAIDQAGWVKSVGAVRGPLGPLKSRTLKSAHFARTLPGAPDGEYVVVKYDTVFDKKQHAVETVTPMKDADGRWHVSGYFIR